MVRSVTCRPVPHAVPASSAPGVSSVGIIAAMADGDGLALVLVEESVVGHSSTLRRRSGAAACGGRHAGRS